MFENKLQFVQNTYTFNYMRVNFMDLKSDYKIDDKDAKLIQLLFKLYMHI